MKPTRMRPFMATLRQLRAYPLTEESLVGLQARLLDLEADMEGLVAVAARERADVDWIENPFVRIGLWLTGRLEEREEREHAEYDAAMAATLERGDDARRLRDWLEALPDRPRVDDARVVSDLEPLKAADLDGLPEDGPALRAIHARIERARELRAIGRLCKQLGAQLGLPKRGRSTHAVQQAFDRIRTRLEAVGDTEVRPLLSPCPGDPSNDRERLTLAREEIGATIRLLHAGVSIALLDVIRAHHRPPGGWEPLEIALKPSGDPR